MGTLPRCLGHGTRGRDLLLRLDRGTHRGTCLCIHTCVCVSAISRDFPEDTRDLK